MGKEQGLIPWQVSIGKDDSYVVIWSDFKSCSWNLNGYDGLVKYLHEKHDPPNTIVLNPYDTRDWFLVQSSGHVLWQLHDGSGNQKLGEIARMGREYMQREARRRGRTFVTTSDGKEYTITPTTDFDKVPESSIYAMLPVLAKVNRVKVAVPGSPEHQAAMQALEPELRRTAFVTLTTIGAAGTLGWWAYTRRQKAQLAAGRFGMHAQSARAMAGGTRPWQRVVSTGFYGGTLYLGYLLGNWQARQLRQG
ncbi:hypothetical protein LTR56_013533 [Elasticomyces elasticus]|nr:hypothetical protein LTR56_013533 [Elasticomyces elasticus]KAK3649550.1 hypothetical protein LTR22_012907 [Elasticomyces elasticus]KAK4933072.1 hypothetical protein LTR49_000556 [Elasticomyces elasticus]KAK5763971.1 hypothetical protein LTS12_005881 [Elasticomyces elasticus]